MSDPGPNAVWLDDHLQLWRHLIHMLSGEQPVIRRLDAPSLRPPLELAPEQGAVALPEYIDWFADREQNRGAYRFLALQLAGRREFGTYDGEHVARLRRQANAPSALADLFALTEGVRIPHHLAAAYPGIAQDARQLSAAWLARPVDAAPATFGDLCDTLLALALAAPVARRLPAWLPPETADQVLGRLAELERGSATAARSLAIAAQLGRLLATPVFQRRRDSGLEIGPAPRSVPEIEAVDAFDLATTDAEEERSRALTELGPGDLDADAAAEDTPGTDAAHSGNATAIDAAGQADSEPSHEAHDLQPRAAGRSRSRTAVGQSFVYDEWDHTIGGYLRRRCSVHELPVPSDSGAFFEHTLHHARPLLAEVRRQFERIRPARYRPLRGLEDGEDFDLNALTEARIEARARRTPSARIYTRRTRQLRDVATLFLVDVSASTDQPYVEPGDPPARRIIDTIKEALVVMSMALQELGDSYAIYAFSSHGPDRVEIYPIKGFDEVLTPAVRARVGGLQPKNGTRMGAALRHSVTKFASTHARGRHLILLSDGFPQDHEYGPDRRSHTYGIEDTAVALREATAAGATPFCITVDRAGQDYLRRMCDASQYLIIDDVDALPRELPKIYQRVVRDG